MNFSIHWVVCKMSVQYMSNHLHCSIAANRWPLLLCFGWCAYTTAHFDLPTIHLTSVLSALRLFICLFQRHWSTQPPKLSSNLLLCKFQTGKNPRYHRSFLFFKLGSKLWLSEFFLRTVLTHVCCLIFCLLSVEIKNKRSSCFLLSFTLKLNTQT